MPLLRLLLNHKFQQCIRIVIFLCLALLGAQVFYIIAAVRKHFENSCPLFYDKGKGGNLDACILTDAMFMFIQCFFAFLRAWLYTNELTCNRNLIPFTVEILFRVLDFFIFLFCIFSSVVLTNGTTHTCRNSSSDVCDPNAHWIKLFKSAQYSAWISTGMWFGANVVNVLKHLVEQIDTFRRISNGLDSEVNDDEGNAVSTASPRSTYVRYTRATGNIQMVLAAVGEQMAAQGMNGRSRVRAAEV